MFSSCFDKGFHVQFENGWTASVQWGTGNYCSNKNLRVSPVPEGPQSSATAEIAAWRGERHKGEWYSFGKYDPSDPESLDRTVEGWQTPAQVLAFLNEIASKED